MRRGERHIKKERPLAARLNPTHRFARKQVSDVALLFDELPVSMPGPRVGAALVLVIPRTHATGQRAVTVVKTVVLRSPLGFRAQVPLPADGSIVATFAQRAGESHCMER